MEAGFIPAGNVPTLPMQAVPQPPPPVSKVIRAPGLKRGKTESAITDRIKLETVFGLTVTSNAALDADPNSEVVAYPAGCTVVLYNTRKNRQNHILSASRKTITCVAFSGDGRYLATGECGHAPCVRIWDLQYDPQVPGATGPQVAEFPSHKYGINCVSFSVNSKYLVSVGSQHDMIVNVWEWRAGLKFASNKVSSKVRAVSFNESGDYFVTVGNRHVKFWYLQYSRSTKYKEPVPLMGRSAILGDLRNNDFCDVACGRGPCADSTYAITKSGSLCEFNNRRLLEKWVELRTPSANCMSLGTNFIFVGCADGIVRCFSPTTLQFVTTLPRTHYLGVDVSQGLNISHMFTHPPGAKYPDTIALTYDEKNQRLTCVYNDHSLYAWDVKDIKRVGKSHSSLYHTACIWGVEVTPEPTGTEESPLPPGSFLTCSSDDTVRIWSIPSHGQPFANIYSDELHKVLYMDPEMTYLKNIDLSLAGEKDKSTSFDGKNGVRSMRISADGQHLASGDRAGNVRVHDFNTMSEVCRIEAHNAEVLCLEYSGGATSGSNRKLLASASRDRLIHVFDVEEGYKLLQTLEDHSASITAVRFLSNDSNLQMVSCGADKTILFRHLSPGDNGSGGQFTRGHNSVARSTLYDMEVDAGGRHVLVACQDRSVRVYSTRTGRHTKSFRGSVGDDGSLIKMVLDRTGIYVATSCTNKSLCVYDYYSGECMATMYGHSEVVTGLSFTSDCQHLISASGDGCIFVWKVPHDMVVTMRARLAQQAIRQKRRPVSSNGMTIDSESERAASPMYAGMMPLHDDPLMMGTRQTPATPNVPQLDLGRLPSWAQKTIAGDANAANKASNSPLKAVVRGKWAQRAEKNDYKAEYYMEPERPMESDGSKDSSLDSGTDTRIYMESKREPLESLGKLTSNPNRRQKLERPRSLNLSMLDGKLDYFSYSYLTTHAPIIGSPRKSLRKNEKENYHSNYLHPCRAQRIERDNKNVPNPTKFPRGVDRVRHHTDDSSLGSFKYEDHESTEHDGDIEDISDGERTSSSGRNTHASDRIIYYPTNEDTTPSEFTVNAMDVEELRQSQRRMKKPTLPLPIVTISATSVSGSGQDSDDDEDEASTPSGDNADRNPLSGSCESLEHIEQRGSFIKSAFESLSGAEIDYNSTQGKSSISSQHHKTSMSRSITSTTTTTPTVPPRNAALISAAKQTLTDPGTTSKRQELNRRIQETRKQLESVGHRTKLKASQSTMDLSFRNDRDADTRPTRNRPVTQILSSGSDSRGYSEKCTCNPSYATTNISKNSTNNHYSQLKHEIGNNNENNDHYYDSLNCNDLNRNRYNLNNESKYKSPYDIPANLNSKYVSNTKTDNPNSAAREFIKKRHEQFEQFTNKTDSSLRLKEIEKSKSKNDTKEKQSCAFNIEFRPAMNSATKTIDVVKGNKVFDRLFPNAAQKSDVSRSGSIVQNKASNVQSRNFTLNLTSCVDNVKPIDKSSTGTVNKSNKARSILKNYKSCPVSPVSEECKWGDFDTMSMTNTVEDRNQNSFNSSHSHVNQNFRDIKKRNSLSYFMDFDTTSHLMKDNGKSLVDTIKSDTEKMIAEITKKYGDLDDYEPTSESSGKIDKNLIPTKDTQNNEEDIPKEKEDGNFSSDSLEDCSLSQDYLNKNKLYTKRICKKHHKNTTVSNITRRCVSDYEIYSGVQEKYTNYVDRSIEMIAKPVQLQYNDQRPQKSFTLPKNMPSNLDDYADEFYGSQEQINNHINNNFQRCSSALTKRCVSRSNESILTDENSNCSSVSNEIFLKYGDQSGFMQRKLIDKHLVDNSQNCSYENLCYEADEAYLDKHRHSSASFFLNQRKNMRNSASQESILSDDLLQTDSDNQMMSKTNCNSLESILSDDSEYTKSAPLEILFEHRKHSRKPEICSSNFNGIAIPKNSQSCYEFDNTSKSYGSSPNNSSYFGNQPYYNSPYAGDGSITPRTIVSSNINTTRVFQMNKEEDLVHKTVTRSYSLQEKANSYGQKKNIAYYFDGSEIREYDVLSEKPRTDEIPSMKTKNEEYESNQRKSLSTNCENKFKYLCNVEGLETARINKSKSCSFEVFMEPPTTIKLPSKRITDKAVSHVQKNLEKFENQIRKNAEARMQKNMGNRQSNNCSNKISSKTAGVTKSLERNTGQGCKNSNGKPNLDFVPHKPPKPVKRTSSVKLTNRNKFSKPVDKYSGLDTGLGANVRAKIDGLQLKNSNTLFVKKHVGDVNGSFFDDNAVGKENIGSNENCEKSFQIFVSEKEVVENKSEIQMDSLEYIAIQRRNEKTSDISLDSLDILDDRNNDAFSKDSLNYESYGEGSKIDSRSTNLTANNQLKNSVSTKNMPFLKIAGRAGECASTSEIKISNLDGEAECTGTLSTEDITMFKDIERKIDIINKLVEMEEKKISNENFLKECRMRPLKANFSDGKGTVKILSRNFEKLASKHQSKPMLDATDFFSLTYDDYDSDLEKNSVKEIRRNRSLPDVLDSESVDMISCVEEKYVNNECENLSGNISYESTALDSLDVELLNDNVFFEVLNNAADYKNDDPNKPVESKKDLKQRVYNVTVIPKTDIHIDSENYESSTTSSSCTNSPKRLLFGNRQKASSRISSLFRNKFDRGRISSLTKTSTDTSLKNQNMEQTKPLILSSYAKNGSLIATNGGLARKLSLQPPTLPPKMTIVQGSRSRLSPNDFSSLVDDETNSGLRRAISLSDLAFKPSPSPRISLQVSGKTSQTGSNGKISGSTRTLGRHTKQSNMTRSSSVGVLNQSDSESEASIATSGRGQNSRVGGLMRPTISSQNKAAPAVARRRGVQPAYSSVNLSSVGQEDSSSEETGNNGLISSSTNIGKPVVPPRPSRMLVDSTGPPHRKNMGRSGSDRDLSSKAREVTNRLTTGVPPSRKHSVPTIGTQNHVADRQNVTSSVLDSKDGKVTPLACQKLAQQLTALTVKIVQVYSSLSDTPVRNETAESNISNENAGMLQGLEAAMLDAQKMITLAVNRLNGTEDQPISISSSTDEDNGHFYHNATNPKVVNNVTKKLDDIVSKGVPTKNGEINQGQAMTMMNQYSDLLYTMVNNFGTTNNAKNLSGNTS